MDTKEEARKLIYMLKRRSIVAINYEIRYSDELGFYKEGGSSGPGGMYVWAEKKYTDEEVLENAIKFAKSEFGQQLLRERWKSEFSEEFNQWSEFAE